MSRYVIWTSDENLEVFVGFDAGMDGFFLTIADQRTCTGETGTYLFHNLDHHPTPQMTLDDVSATLARFGLTLPPDLTQQLASDGNDCCRVPVGKAATSSAQTGFRGQMRILGWQNAS